MQTLLEKQWSSWYCKPDGFVIHEVVIVDDINNNSGRETTKMDLVMNVRFERRLKGGWFVDETGL